MPEIGGGVARLAGGLSGRRGLSLDDRQDDVDGRIITELPPVLRPIDARLEFERRQAPTGSLAAPRWPPPSGSTMYPSARSASVKLALVGCCCEPVDKPSELSAVGRLSGSFGDQLVLRGLVFESDLRASFDLDIPLPVVRMVEPPKADELDDRFARAIWRNWSTRFLNSSSAVRSNLGRLDWMMRAESSSRAEDLSPIASPDASGARWLVVVADLACDLACDCDGG